MALNQYRNFQAHSIGTIRDAWFKNTRRRWRDYHYSAELTMPRWVNGLFYQHSCGIQHLYWFGCRRVMCHWFWKRMKSWGTIHIFKFAAEDNQDAQRIIQKLCHWSGGNVDSFWCYENSNILCRVSKTIIDKPDRKPRKNDIAMIATIRKDLFLAYCNLAGAMILWIIDISIRI